MKKFNEVICIKSGTVSKVLELSKYGLKDRTITTHFKKGDIYAVCGWNNGIHLLYETQDGTGLTLLLHNYDFILRDADTLNNNSPEFQ